MNAVKLNGNSPLLQLHSTNPDLYERFVLAAFNGDPEFSTKTQSILCFDHVKGVYRSDFVTPAYFKLFICMVQWRSDRATAAGSLVPESMSTDVMRVQLMAFAANRPEIIAEAEIPGLLGVWEEVLKVNVQLASMVLDHTFETWLLSRRATLAADDYKKGILTPEGLMVNLQEQALRVSAVQENTASNFGDFLFSEEPPIERLPLGTGFSVLDNVTGGGFGKTELALFIAPTGGGKTVLATQLAAQHAFLQRQVLFISTEQGIRELEPRIISSRLSIDFDRIKDGGNIAAVLKGDELTRVRNTVTALNPYLHFEVWRKGSGMTVEADLDKVCAKNIAKFGKIDCLVFDWIGGALTKTAAADMIRIVYQRAAVTLKALAEKYNMAVIAFAQAVSATDHVKVITDKHIAECKYLHHEAEVCIGFSALKNSASEDSSSVRDAYAEIQYFNAIKARKGTATTWPMRREFKYQRFREPTK